MLLQSLINLKCHYFSRGEIIIFFFYAKQILIRIDHFHDGVSLPLVSLLLLLILFLFLPLHPCTPSSSSSSLFLSSTSASSSSPTPPPPLPSFPFLPLPPPPPLPLFQLYGKQMFLFFFLAGLRAVAHLWQEFVLEMRYRWENDIFIPRYCGKKFSAPSEVTYNLGEITVLELLSLHRVSSYKQGI